MTILKNLVYMIFDEHLKLVSIYLLTLVSF